MSNVRNWDIVVREFKQASRYHVQIRTNALGKGLNASIPPAVSLQLLLLFVYKKSFDIN